MRKGKVILRELLNAPDKGQVQIPQNIFRYKTTKLFRMFVFVFVYLLTQKTQKCYK